LLECKRDCLKCPVISSGRRLTERVERGLGGGCEAGRAWEGLGGLRGAGGAERGWRGSENREERMREGR
jgi:hypothetical protein